MGVGFATDTCPRWTRRLSFFGMWIIWGQYEIGYRPSGCPAMPKAYQRPWMDLVTSHVGTRQIGGP